MSKHASQSIDHRGVMDYEEQIDTYKWSRVVDKGVFFFQAEDGIRDLVRSRGLGDVYKRQLWARRPRWQIRSHSGPA